MIRLLPLVGVFFLTSVSSAQTRVGNGVDSSPLQLDLVAPGIDLRSTDNINVIQRIEDANGKTWYIRQQGALFALYPRGVRPQAVGQDVVPPGTRWFIGIQNLQQALGFSSNKPLSMVEAEQDAIAISSPKATPLFPLGSRADTPNADRWLYDKLYRQRAVMRWLQRIPLR
jgi:hypothetical protein|tara:strand:- start:2117 stop:2629 length:513 start_codon:yes stop_codon:yes gene_type:complete